MNSEGKKKKSEYIVQLSILFEASFQLIARFGPCAEQFIVMEACLLVLGMIC